MSMNTRTMEEIIERKRAGIDCTEDESAYVKRYFDHLARHGSGEDGEAAALFPLEWDEWCTDREAGVR